MAEDHLIRIIIRALNEAGPTLAKLKAEVDSLDKQTSSLNKGRLAQIREMARADVDAARAEGLRAKAAEVASRTRLNEIKAQRVQEQSAHQSRMAELREEREFFNEVRKEEAKAQKAAEKAAKAARTAASEQSAADKDRVTAAQRADDELERIENRRIKRLRDNIKERKAAEKDAEDEIARVQRAADQEATASRRARDQAEIDADRRRERSLKENILERARLEEDARQRLEQGEAILDRNNAGARVRPAQRSQAVGIVNDISRLNRDRAVLSGLAADARRLGADGEHDLARFQHGIADIDDELRRLQRQGDNLEKLAGGFGILTSALSGAQASLSNASPAAAGFLAILSPMIGIVVALAGGLVAIAASAAAAGAAIGGALVTAMAVAAPGVLLLVAAFAKLISLFQLAGQQSQDQQKQGLKQAKTAVDNSSQIANAQDALAAAQRRLTEARKQAIRNLEDLILAEKEAKLSFLDSVRARDQAVRKGNVDALPGLELNVEKDKLASSRATSDLNTAQSQGVAGNPGVVAAQQGVVQAQRALADALKGTADAGVAASSALDLVNDKIAKLTPAEKRLFDAIVKLKDVFKKEFGTILAPILDSFTSVINGIITVLQDPAVQVALKRLATGIGASITAIAKIFTGPEGRKLLIFFTNTLTNSLPGLTKGFGGLVRIFMAIAVAAKPIYDYLLKGFAGFGDHLTKSSRNSKGLSDFFKSALGSLKLWLSLLGSIFGLFGSLFKSGAKDAGDSLVGTFTKALDHAADWLDKHPKQVREFFDKVVSVLGILGGLLLDLGGFLIKNLNPETVKSFADVFSNTLLPALQSIVDISEKFIDFIDFLTNIPGVKEILALGAALFVLEKATGAVSLVFGGLKLAAGLLVSIFAGGGAEGAAAGAAAGGPIALAILGIAAAIYLLDRRFHFIAPTISFIKKIFGEVIDFVTEHWKGLLQILGGPLGVLVVTIVNHFDAIKKGIETAFDGIKVAVDWLKTNVWDKISGPIDTAVQAMYHPIATFILGVIKLFDNFDLATAIWSAISGIAGVVANVFNTVKDGFRAGMMFILDAVREVLGIIDGLLGTTWAKKVPSLGTNQSVTTGSVAAPSEPSITREVPAKLKFAQGGYIPARQGGQTILVSEAGHGEWVVPSDPNMKDRRQKLMKEIAAFDKEPFGDAGVPESGHAFAGADTSKAAKKDGLGGLGGSLGGGSRFSQPVRHLLAALKAAKHLDSENIPYVYGGGHVNPVTLPGTGSGIASPSGRHYAGVGLDCSSSVAYVMQQAGYSFPTGTSGEYMSYGKSGPGGITIWANPAHTFMDIGGIEYGTGAHANGGFGRHDHTHNGFVARHPNDMDGGVLGKLAGLPADVLGKVLDVMDRAKEIAEKAFSKLSENPVMNDMIKWIKDKFVGVLSDPSRWFEQGGFIPGAGPQPIVGHGGELVLTGSDQRELLDSIRGKGAHKRSGGGVIGGGLFNAIAEISGLKRGSLTRLSEALKDLFGDGGLFDRLGDAVASASARFSRSRILTNLRQNSRGQVTDSTNAGREARAAVGELTTENNTLDREAGVLGRLQDRLEARRAALLKKLRRGGLSADARKKIGAIIRSLTAGINNISGRIDTVQDAIAANLQSLYDAQTAVVQAIVDAAANRAQNRTAAADVRRRMRTFLVGADQAGVEFANAQVKILTSEADSLREALTAAKKAGKTKLAAAIRAQIKDLDAAILDATATAFNAATDAINNRAGRRLSLDDTYAQIAALGGKTPFGTGDAGVKAANIDKLKTLQRQGTDLQAQLDKAIKDKLGPDIIAGLTQAVADNTLAQLQQTKVISDLNGTMTELQGFSSSSWTWFRQAVFNGTGGLMSQYAIPSAAIGADVLRGGLARVHDGEEIRPAVVSRRASWGNTGGGIEQNFNIYQDDRPVDTVLLGNKMAFELEHVLS